MVAILERESYRDQSTQSTTARPQVGDSCSEMEKTDSTGIEIPGLGMATTSNTSVHVLKSVVCRSSQEMADTRLWNFTNRIDQAKTESSINELVIG